jgi:hypothetical protein
VGKSLIYPAVKPITADPDNVSLFPRNLPSAIPNESSVTNKG